MIIGLGSDIVDIRRIEKTLERYGEQFIDRIFTDVERDKSDRRADRAASYARRFAAKEACAKALGTGFKNGVFWRDLGVVNLPTGQPTMALRGGAARRFAELVSPGAIGYINVTITDDYPLAHAIVIITCVAEPPQRKPFMNCGDVDGLMTLT
jgi:holo-[acyl-carrier protein] synthase